MKNSFLILISISFLVSVRAAPPLEVQIANDFLAHLNIQAGNTNATASNWNAPTQFLFETNIIDVTEQENGHSWLLASNNDPWGTISEKGFASEFHARLSWALKQTSCAAPPSSYYNSYLTDRKGDHLIMVFQGDAPVLTNQTDSSRIYCLWNNHVFTCESVGNELSALVFQCFLRAGGVDIPDDPFRSSPAPESFQVMRVFSSGSKEPSDSPPPAPESFQAMLVFPSDLGNETDSSASESRPESEIKQEF